MTQSCDAAAAASLDCIQQKFAAALWEPAESAALMPSLRGNTAVNARRFDGYRGNLVATWCKALAATCPVLRRQVGASFFDALCRDYGRAHPSRGGDLNQFGSLLPEFLDGFAPVRPYPWLPDLARLEWCVHRAHYARDVQAIDAAFIEKLSPSDFDGLQLGLHPAVATLHSEWNVADVWLWHQEEAPGEWKLELHRSATALVSRPVWKVQVRAVEAAEAAAIDAMARGESLGVALERAFAADPAVDVAQLFGRWLVDRMLVAAPHIKSKDSP